MSAKWKVEHLCASGWEDAEWTDDGQPMRFDSRAEAVQEIRDHVKECRIAVACGSMESAPRLKDFRAVRTITEVCWQCSGPLPKGRCWTVRLHPSRELTGSYCQVDCALQDSWGPKFRGSRPVRKATPTA